MEQKNGYEFTKMWYHFARQNADLIKPVHGILYLMMVELNNMLGWVDKFGIPTYNTMALIGVKDYKTYKKAFNDLEKWNLIKVVARAKNQNTSTIIALVKNPKAHPKALPLYKTGIKTYKTGFLEKNFQEPRESRKITYDTI
jgi:hypothetical protein